MVENQIKRSFEEVLSLIGGYGPFQWVLNAIFVLMHMSICVHLVLVSFSTLPPSWKCATNSSICTQYGTFSGNNLQRCNYQRKDWQYVSDHDYSMVSTFNLDCEKEWLAHFLSSIMFLAWAIGSLFFGWISDNFGRKPVLFVSTGVIIVVGFASSFCKTLPLYITSRFLIGFFYSGSVLQSFIIITEVVGNRYRPFAGNMIWFGDILGWNIVALEFYLVRNWRVLHILNTAPYIIDFAFYKFIPESIQWQYEYGKLKEVKSTMERIAYWNKKKVSLKDIDFILPEKIEKRTNPIDLFRTKRIAFLTMVQALLWFCVATGYYGAVLSNLGGSVYMNFVILNFGSSLAFFIAPYCCTRFGRKKSTISFLFITAFSCISNGFISFKLLSVRVIVGMTGMICITMGFNSIFTWSGEIYPTIIRSEVLGFLEISSRLGSAISPFIGNYLRHFGTWVPYTTMSSILIIGVFSCFLLPETKDMVNDWMKDFSKSETNKSNDIRLNIEAGVSNDNFSADDI